MRQLISFHVFMVCFLEAVKVGIGISEIPPRDIRIHKCTSRSLCIVAQITWYRQVVTSVGEL